jgi:hypothetical protein
MQRDIETIWNRIPLAKREGLIREGFDEAYLKEILTFRPSEQNVDFDMNSITRQALGIDMYVPQVNVSASAAARMSAGNFHVIPAAPRYTRPKKRSR